jgi:hypothetical protein
MANKRTLAALALIIPSLITGICVGWLQRVSAADVPSVMTTQALRIVDSQGNLRAALSVNPQSGVAGLSIFEIGNQSPRIVVSVRQDGVGVVELRDSSGSKRGELAAGSGGGASLTLSDQNQGGQSTPRLVAGVAPQSGAASVSMFEPNNSNPRILLGVKSDGIGSVELRDSDGNKRGELTAASSGDVRLNLVNKDLKGGLVLASSAGETVLVFNDSQPKHRALLRLNASGDPSAAMYDKDGKAVWQVP